jgi:hypothetical protein
MTELKSSKQDCVTSSAFSTERKFASVKKVSFHRVNISLSEKLFLRARYHYCDKRKLKLSKVIAKLLESDMTTEDKNDLRN